MKLLLLYPLLAVMLAASCGTQKETSNTSSTPNQPASKNNSAAPDNTVNTSTTSDNTTKTTPPTAVKNDSTYRLIVSFISIGEGIDAKAKENMDSMVNSWNEKMKSKLNVETFRWGREGEVDYCLKLNELNAKDQDAFVADVKTAFKGNSLVQILENQTSRHKR